MAFTPKDWQNNLTTPLSAEAIKDLEERVTDGYFTSGDAEQLELAQAGSGISLTISARDHAFFGEHSIDHEGEVNDLVGLHHKSTGDAIFALHQGGEPPAYAGDVGGNALFNGLIPYHLDGEGTGRDGSVVNDRLGMKGLFIDAQTPNDRVNAILVRSFTNEPAVRLEVQGSPDTVGGEPQGDGGALDIYDYAPTTPTFRIFDENGAQLFVIEGNSQSGRTTIGAGPQFDNQLTLYKDDAGIARTLALHNPNETDNSGSQIEFDDDNGQWALIQGIRGGTGGMPFWSGELRFSITKANAAGIVRRLWLSETGIGFFETAPVAKQEVTGSRGGNAALASVIDALEAYGLVTDSSS